MAVKIEVGKKYELNNGDVHECVRMDGDDHIAVDKYGLGPFVINGVLYHQDGRFADCDLDHDLSVKREVLTIEPGKYYRTRDGRKVGPMEEEQDGDFMAVHPDMGGRLTASWKPNGKRWMKEPNLDLIAEWGDETRDPELTSPYGDGNHPLPPMVPETGTLAELQVKAGDYVFENIKEFLNYDGVTGEFTWVKAPNGRVRVGSVAGSSDKDGYIRISFAGKKYSAHRLAWMYTYGEMPNCEIDHINRTPSDNRIENLREATVKQNSYNQGISKSNTSGFKGVDYHKKSKKYRARIRVDGVLYHIGFYENPEDASKAYNDYAKMIHEDFYADTTYGIPDLDSIKMEALG